MHALIIEQDMWVIVMIEDVLRPLGYSSFDFAASVEAAIDCAEKKCPDLVTADLHLDSGSGIEAVSHICSEAPIPVVYVTATPWEVHEHLKDAVVVAKPFSAASLEAGVARATQTPAR